MWIAWNVQLDALKAYPNVLVLTTSNITEAIDLAFVDRADIKAYVGPPGAQVRAPDNPYMPKYAVENDGLRMWTR